MLLLVACGPTGGSPDSGTDGGGGNGGDAGTDGGRDAGLDAGTFDAGPPPPIACIEAEDAMLLGDVRTWPGTKETVGGTAVLGPMGTGSLAFDFELFKTTQLTAWARVRALTHANNSLTVQLGDGGTDAGDTWDIPVTPVLRWQRIDRRGDTGTFWRAEDLAWPGSVGAGTHQLVLTGAEPGVELDAICLYPKGVVPEERLPEPPDRVVTDLLTGAVGDGVTDDTSVLRAAFTALKVGDVLQLPAGRFRFTAPLSVTVNGVSLVGAEDGGTVLFADLPATATVAALTIGGAPEVSPVPLVEDAPALSHELAVALGATVQAGDAVLLSSDDWAPSFRNRANTAHVVAARNEPTRRVLVLDRAVLGPFLVANKAKVERFSPVRDFVMQRVSVEGPNRGPMADGGAGNPTIDLISAARCDRCFFTDLRLSRFRGSGLDTSRSVDLQVIRVQASDAPGTGVTVTRAQGTVVRDSRFTGAGAALALGSRETFVYRNTFDQAGLALRGEDAYANLLEGNLIRMADPGISIGGAGNDGPFNVVRGNDLRDTTDGVAIAKATVDTVVERNLLTRPTRYGVRVESGSNDTWVWANTFAAWSTAGVFSRDSAGLDVRGNAFVAVGSAVAVQIVDGGGYTVRDNALGDGGVVLHPDAGDVGGNR